MDQDSIKSLIKAKQPAAVLICWLLGVSLMANKGLADSTSIGHPQELPASDLIRKDPFIEFVEMRVGLDGLIKRFLQLPSTSSDAQRQRYLMEARHMAMMVTDKEHELMQFYSTTVFPPDARAIADPVVEALQSEITKGNNGRVPSKEELDKATIQDLQAVYKVFYSIPLPSESQLNKYRAAWGPTPITYKKI
jgi:hypothetical protein